MPTTPVKYLCVCGNESFRLELQKVRGTWGDVHEHVLICTRCLTKHRIGTCQTPGLQQRR